jgi:hypothetical protein
MSPWERHRVAWARTSEALEVLVARGDAFCPEAERQFVISESESQQNASTFTPRLTCPKLMQNLFWYCIYSEE